MDEEKKKILPESKPVKAGLAEELPTQEELKEELKEIYKPDEQEGKKPEEELTYFSTIEKGKTLPAWKKLLIGFFIVLGFCAAASIAGFMVFQNKAKFSGDRVSISFSGPESISSGDSFTFIVAYENSETVGLKNANVTLSFPEGFVFEEASPPPSNDFHNAWEIGDIGTGAKGTIIVHGRIVGGENAKKTISGRLNFEPANFSSPFDARESYDILIHESAISALWEVSPRAAIGSPFAGKIILSNSSTDALKDIRVDTEFSSDLLNVSFDPKPTSGSSWDIAELSPDKPYEIAFQGTFQGANGDFKELKAKASIRNDNNEFIIQSETNTLITLIDPSVEAALSVNGRTSAFSVDWGETLDIVLSIANNGDQTVKDAVAAITVDSTIIDWDKLRWTNEGTKDGNTLQWTKEKSADLAEIAPGSKVTLSVSLPLVGQVPKNVSSNDLVIGISGELSSSNVADLGGVQIQSKAAPLEIRVSTQVKLRPEARFVDDEYQPLGSGPVPPQVNETTTYQIQWYLSNASNEVSNAMVETTLPSNVFWAGQESASSGSISFDPSTRKATWFINRVPARSGTDLPGLTANFLVSIAPTEADLGNPMTLSAQTTLSATDSATNEEIQKRFDFLTTDIPTDPKYAGQGKVITGVEDNANSNTNTNSN